MSYVVYSRADTGEVMGYATLRQGDEPTPPPGSTAVLCDWAPTAGDYVLDGSVVKRPNRPSAAHVWDRQSRTWVIDLGTAKARQRAEINTWRNARELEAFQYGGHWFDGDLDSQRRLQLAATAAQQALLAGVSPEPSIDWTLADNNTVTLTATQILAAARAMGDNMNSLHQQARALKAQIDAATTLDEVLAVTPPAP